VVVALVVVCGKKLNQVLVLCFLVETLEGLDFLLEELLLFFLDRLVVFRAY
jgi:hypothetical protein